MAGLECDTQEMPPGGLGEGKGGQAEDSTCGATESPGGGVLVGVWS